ncbi:MAG TPA: hypothetical protein VJL54_02010 [Nitrososphaera sp.]|nr:hypothetical protein [Nitrososphaera sp.]
MGQSSELVLKIGIALEDIFPFLRNVVASSSKLSLVQEDEGKLRIDLCKADKIHPTCLFNIAILPDGGTCELHFTPIRQEDGPGLASSVAALVLAISEYNRLKPLRFIRHASSKFGVTESDLERIATFLEVNPGSTLPRIADALAMEQFAVAIGLQLLIERDIVGSTTNPRSFFLK